MVVVVVVFQTQHLLPLLTLQQARGVMNYKVLLIQRREEVELLQPIEAVVVEVGPTTAAVLVVQVARVL